MKTGLMLLVAASITPAVTSDAIADILPNLPELVTMTPEHVFAPQGFDNNDNAQIIISGEMMSTCWRAGPAAAQVDTVRKTILIRNRDWVYESCWCLSVPNPYVKTIDLGVLPAGVYKILVEQRTGEPSQKGDLSIGVSTTAGPDDHLYALVEEARLDADGEGPSKRLTLSGTLPSNCMELSEIKVKYRASNIIEVLPILSLVDETTCQAKKRAFRKELTLSPNWKGSTLIHIRSLNGQSLNKVTEF